MPAMSKELRVLNVKKDLSLDDVEALLERISLCNQLEELTFMGPIPKDKMEPLFNAIGKNCPGLKTLDISRMYLTIERSTILRPHHNLKSLSVNIAKYNIDYPFLGIFSDKTQLEDLTVVGHLEMPIGTLVKSNSSLPFFLSDVIATQRSVKSLDIDYENEDIVGQVFSTNKGLEDVTLKGLEISGSCLRHLPSTLKKLDVLLCTKINLFILMQCLEGWKLQSLGVDIGDETPNFIVDLVAKQPTLQHLTLYCGERPLRTLGFLQHLKELKTLKLINMKGNQNQELCRVTGSCINLELLEIEGEELDFNEDLFALIAALPKLKEIGITHYQESYHPSYNALMRCLSISASLTTARFKWCNGLTNEDVLTLLRGSHILTDLKLTGSAFTVDLVTEISEVLAQQEDRTNILNVTFDEVRFSLEDIPEESCHRLLKVTFKH